MRSTKWREMRRSVGSASRACGAGYCRALRQNAIVSPNAFPGADHATDIFQLALAPMAVPFDRILVTATYHDAIRPPQPSPSRFPDWGVAGNPGARSGQGSLADRLPQCP